MTFRAILTLSPYLLSAIISFWLGIQAAKRHSVPGSNLFAWAAFSEVVWTIAYMCQLVSTDLPRKLLWNNIQFIGAIGAPLAVLGFALEYDRPTKTIWSRLSWKYFVPPALLLLAFIWTDGIHHLFRGQPAIQAGEPFSKLVFSNGPGFALYTIFAYSLLVLMVMVLFPRYLRAGRFYRLQISVLLIGILIPWITSIITALEIVPARLHDATPITFAVSNLIIAWALFRYHLFETLPAARDFLVENMQEGVVVLDHLLRIIDVNPSAANILGIREAKSLGRSILSIAPFERAWFEGMPPERSQKIEALIERENFIGVYELQMSLLSNPRGQADLYLMILRDISTRKRFEEKLNYLAITDSLTNIFNRRHVMFRASEEVERARKSASPLSLVLIDIDHFKTVNDTFGHRVGDEALQAIVSRCGSVLRSPDIFGRYGGEEFLVVLPETDAGTASQIAERLRDQVEKLALQKDGKDVKVTISLGVASAYPSADFDLDKLLDWADQALYSAKSEGRNRVHIFQP